MSAASAPSYTYTYDLIFTTDRVIDLQVLRQFLDSVGAEPQPLVMETIEDDHDCVLCDDCNECHDCLDNTREIEL